MAKTTPRVVLVTGSAGGIGRAMGAALLPAGHRIAALDHDAKGLRALLAEHRGHPDLHAIEADLSTASGCEAGMSAAVAHFGRVEAVVNNAGIGVSSLRPDAESRALPETDDRPSQAGVASVMAGYAYGQVGFEFQQTNDTMF